MANRANMINRKCFFAFIFVLLSLLLGFFLGLVDFFGFLSGQHSLNLVYLGLALFAWHILGLIIFLLVIEKTKLHLIYFTTSLLFGLVFFGFSKNYLASLLIVSSYFLFQIYTQKTLSKRAKLFVNYSTREVVFPVIRRSFIFLILILVIIGFFQSSNKARKSELVTPYMVNTLSRPFILLLNKQLSVQMQEQLALQNNLSIDQKQAVVSYALSQKVQTLNPKTTQQLVGLDPQEIPIQKTIISESAQVDLSPVISEMSFFIANNINQQLNLYLPIVPLFFAVLVFIFVSPLVAISEILLLPLIKTIIAILISTKIISVQKQSVEQEVLVIN